MPFLESGLLHSTLEDLGIITVFHFNLFILVVYFSTMWLCNLPILNGSLGYFGSYKQCCFEYSCMDLLKKYIYIFLLGIHLGMELVYCQVSVSFSCVNTAKQMSRVVAVYPSYQWWMGGFSGSTLSTLGVGVWLLGVVEVPECIVVFLFLSVFRALAPVMALGWVPRLLSAPIRDGFMGRRRSRSKTGVCFWKKIPREHDGTLLGFLAVAFVEDISVLGLHPLGHFWWKLIQICPYVTHFFFFNSPNPYVQTVHFLYYSKFAFNC